MSNNMFYEQDTLFWELLYSFVSPYNIFYMEGDQMAIHLKQKRESKVLDKGYAIVQKKPRLIADGLKELKIDDVVEFEKVKNMINLVYYRVYKIGSTGYQTCSPETFIKIFKVM